MTSFTLILPNCFLWLDFYLSLKEQPQEVAGAVEEEVVEDEVEQEAGPVEDSADVVEEVSAVLGVVVEVLVAAAGVVVLEAGLAEGSGGEVDHRFYKVPTSSSSSDFW